MPNGRYEPQCQNCEYYVRQDETGRCKKHCFVVPLMGIEPICRDWQLRKDFLNDSDHFQYVPKFVATAKFRSLLPGCLYFYDPAADSFKPIGTFDQFSKLVLSTCVKREERLGWVLPISDCEHGLFPDVGSDLILHLENQEVTGRVVEIDREIIVTGKPTKEYVKLLAQKHIPKQRAIVCPEAPEQIYRWLDQNIDLASYTLEVGKQRLGSQTLTLGFFVLVEILEPRRAYALRIDRTKYEGYMRTPK